MLDIPSGMSLSNMEPVVGIFGIRAHLGSLHTDH